MRILIITQYFYPENFKSTDIAEELVKRGHQVDALVGIPNYPEGSYYKGYGIFKKRHEYYNGVNIYRCFQSPRGSKSTAIGLSLNYLTFVISAIFWVLFFFIWRKKYDAIITHEPSPITQIIPAIILGKIKKTPVYSWILDIWPDSMLSAIGEKRGKYLKGILTQITEMVYKNSKLILVSSKGMMELVNRHNNYSNKLVYFPNWCDDILEMPKSDSIILPDKTIIMMAGSLNNGIGVDAVINLVDSLRDVDEIVFVFVGGGAKEEEMRKVFAMKDFKNIIMTGRLPFTQMPSIYEQADAMLLTLRETNLPHLKATVPARMQSYMAAGKPVLAMIDGCAKDIINESGCGYAVSAGDYISLSEYIRNKFLANIEEFKAKGINSRTFFEKYYKKDKCISNLEYYLSGGNIHTPPYEIPFI